MQKTKKRLILIDSNALLHRAFHALPPLTKKDGTLTNAVYGYALTLLSVWEKFKPDYIAATFDLAGPTFRHKQYEDYKATRKKAPDEFYTQIPMAKELLKAFNIPIYEKQGYEADDMIGTIAKDPQMDGQLEKIIVTGDLDTLQLVDDNVRVFTLRRGISDTILYDSEKVKERYGLLPEQMVEYKALRGDQSDNIPGVKGIGEKTAIELLKQYKNIDKLYQNIDSIESKSVKRKLEEGKESAYLSRQLATIDINTPIDFDLEKCRSHDYDKKEVLEFLQRMEFYSLAKRLEGKTEAGKGKLADDQVGKTGNTAEREDRPKLKIITTDTDKSVKEVLAAIRKSGWMAFSFSVAETQYYKAKISGVGITCSERKAATFVPESNMAELAEIFNDKEILKIGYNLKFEYELLKKIDSSAKLENFFDVQIAAYMLRSGTAVDLDKLVLEEYGSELQHQISKKGQTSLLGGSSEDIQKGAGERAFWIRKLYDEYKEKLHQVSQEQEQRNGNGERTLEWVMKELEFPLVPIIAEMEMTGVRIRREALEKVSKQAEEELAELEKKIFKLAGEVFNINSPVQLAKVLYEDLGLPTQEIKRGKTGYSTDADQLRKIRELHPIIPYLENYRELFKIKTTYTDSLPTLVEDDGRIHAHFNQAVTATGRLSSSDPNLQNIPKKGKLATLIREAFIAEKGYGLVSADYSQIDLRAAAHLSDDPRLIEAFATGKDIHRATAAWVNGIAESEVTGQQRSEAKSLNFGVLYGMGTYGFMRDSGVSRQRAEFFIDQYMKRFANLKRFLEETKEFARKNGYVETELGRRRYIPNINAGNFQLRHAAERMAINLPVQGLSADIMKLAMKAVHGQLLKKYEDNARLILQIHDELIFEVKESLADKFMSEVKAVMEGVYKLKVPLVVEVGKGACWADL